MNYHRRGKGRLTLDWEGRRWRTPPCRRRGGRTANQRRWSVNCRQRGVRANHHRRERSEANHHFRRQRWSEFIFVFFHFILKWGTAAPSTEGRGRKHTPRRRGKAPPPKRSREGEVHLSFLVVLPPFSSLGWECAFSCPPWSGADFAPLPCWVVLFSFFQKKKKH